MAWLLEHWMAKRICALIEANLRADKAHSGFGVRSSIGIEGCVMRIALTRAVVWVVNLIMVRDDLVVGWDLAHVSVMVPVPLRPAPSVMLRTSASLVGGGGATTGITVITCPTTLARPLASVAVSVTV